MKKKVLILVNHDIVIYNFRKELVARLIQENYEVYLSSPMGERIPKLISMGCHYEEIIIDRHGMNPFKELKLIKEYKELIKKIKPDVVLTYTIKPNIYGAIAAKNYDVPCLANITGLGTAVEKKSLLQNITTSLYKFAFKKIHTVFFQNEENMNFFRKQSISNGKYVLIPGSGVNVQEYQLLSYPNDKIVKFVFISRIMKEKGIDQYLEAAQLLKRKYDNLEFHICGFCEEAYEDELKNLEEKGIIIYHGMVSNIKEILKDMHCTIHPTYYPEGMSNVLLESCASGRPIITTNRSGCREIVQENVNGYLINSQDTEDLVKKIEKFLLLTYEQKTQMGVAGRNYVVEKFDRKIVVNKYIEILNKM